ncbi:MAG: hypothetical protein ABI234_12580 [Ktedonobacteraceae bacterium]
MHVVDLTIDQPQQSMQQLVRTYENILSLEGASVSAVSQFESEGLTLLEEGWQLKLVSHRGSMLVPQIMVVATYEK